MAMGSDDGMIEGLSEPTPSLRADPPETGGWGERVVGGFCVMNEWHDG